MKQSTCSAVICQPSGREQKHDNYIIIITINKVINNKSNTIIDTCT